MFSVYTLAAFVIGYLVRHLDILRFHLPANPLFTAVGAALADSQKKASQALIAKITS